DATATTGAPPAGFGLWRVGPQARAAKRREDQADLASGLDGVFEAPRATCPWGGGGRILRLFSSPDITQCKPGRFRYDPCGDCGHTFQNPRLSLAGLEFYYRDFYDGLGAALIETVFGFSPDPYLARARMMPPHPQNWLDVGAGLGHFCNVARDVWPTTRFD